MMVRTILLFGLSLAAIPASAQDVPSPYESAITDHAQLQLHSTLAKRRLEQARQRQRGAASTATVGPRGRAVCLDKRRIAARLPAYKARQLYALCAQAGL